MHHAIAHEFRIFKPGYHTEHALLFTEFKISLEPDYVIKRSFVVFLSELHHGIRALARARINYAYWLQRAVGKRHRSALCHHLNGHAAFKHARCFKLVQRRGFGSNKVIYEREVLLFAHGAIQIIVAAFVARAFEYFAHIERFRAYDRRNCVIKVQPFAKESLYRFKHCAVRKRARSNYCGRIGQACHLAVFNGYVLVFAQALGNQFREYVPVNGQCASRGHAAFLRALHYY